ncbi:unnamed protein product [Somion occarium]
MDPTKCKDGEYSSFTFHSESENQDVTLHRDDRFYLPDADCVIRVGDTLFKVHKFLLARDSSAFQHMFTLPPDHSLNTRHLAQEGASDQNPIILYGESEDNFRVLLGLLYSLPHELQVYHTASVQLPQLITLTSILNKYHFSGTCAWALCALYNVLSGGYGTTPAQYSLSECSERLLERIVEVACVCEHQELRNYVEERWMGRIWGLNSDPLNGKRREKAVRRAVRVADTWGMKRLAGVAYYVLLVEMDGKIERTFSIDPSSSASSDEGTNEDDQTPPPLSPVQIIRLLSGHMSLVSLWDQLRRSAPAFARPDGCVFHVHGCLSVWSSAWAEAARSDVTLNKYRSCDIVGRLKRMEEQLMGNTDLQCALTPGCRRKAMFAIRELVSSVTDGLAGHFVDVVNVDEEANADGGEGMVVAPV